MKYRLKRVKLGTAVLQVWRWYWPFWITISLPDDVRNTIGFYHVIARPKFKTKRYELLKPLPPFEPPH